MANANSNINVSELDFDTIKSSLKTYLKNQSEFNDYNFEGSVISTVLDILAYNTHYNAFYLNMVANEMFLDTALKRSSIISHAKLMNYTPRSCICSTAVLNLTFNGLSSSTFTVPKYTKFYSEAIDGINYPFVTLDELTVNVSDGTATFTEVPIYQGQAISYTFDVNTSTNPKLIFKLPDSTIDLSTLKVYVYPYAQSTDYEIYNISSTYLTLDGTSNVYFVQESLDGYYEIYFGDGILGKTLTTSNIVVVEYLATKATTPNGVSKFTLMNNIGPYSSVSITATQSASGGKDKETIDSIKFQAPKSFSAQNRAVTKEDYITAIQQNKFGYTFDSVSVWGGEENEPPVYGQVFICIKPSEGYLLTDTQKQKLITDVIKPISVMTVTPTLVDPDYTYVKLKINVVYDPKVTTLSANQIKTTVTSLVQSFAESTLNTFNSTFMASELNSVILNADKSIITNEVNIELEKKFLPSLTNVTTYNLYYGAPLKKGLYSDSLNSSPPLSFRDTINLSNIITGIQIEEVPTFTVGVESISLINPGFGYQFAPTVTIIGDGTGATAEAILSATGSIKSIVVTNAGTGYTSAIAKITPAANDTTGQLGSAIVNLQGRYGTLRLYYNNTDQAKTIFNENIGTIDYTNGIVTLNSFNPVGVDDPLGQLSIASTPTTTIFSSTYNRIITLDQYDPNAIIVNVIAKT